MIFTTLVERYCYCLYFIEEEIETWRIDYLALVLRFDESFTSAEMAFLPLRHQRRQKFNPNSQFLYFQRLESRAVEGVVPGQFVGMIMAWVGRAVESVLLLAFCKEL